MKINFRKIISYYKPYKKIFFLDLLFSFLSASITLSIPFILKYLTNILIYTTPDLITIKYTVTKFTMTILLLLLLKFCFDRFTVYYGHLIGAKMEADMRTEIFNHYQKMSFSFFDEHETGDLLSRITIDLTNMSELLHHFPERILQVIIIIGGSIIWFFILNVQEALIFLIILLIFISFLFLSLNKNHKMFLKNHKELSKINSQLEDSINGIRLTKTLANENLEKQKFEINNMKFISSQQNCFKTVSIFFSGYNILIVSILPIITLSSITLFYNNKISIEILFAFLLCVNIILGPISLLISQIELFQNTIAGFQRFCEMLDIKSEIMESENAVELQNIKGNIKFKNIYFHYKTGEEIFKNLNLEIKAGEYIAFVGPSGIGKSTLCNLIPRFYDVSSGEVLIDGINVKNIKLENLRKNIGFVQQDTFLFSGTILENIKYGNPKATMEEVISATKDSYIHDFIMSLSKKYDTQVGQRGCKLSGGQKQRIAIARVFLQNPSILIFDEATSSLDNESEKYIQKSIEKLSKDRTTIVIAHRLSTIKNVKRILVLDNGKILEEGTHKELLNKNGMYAEFFNLF